MTTWYCDPSLPIANSYNAAPITGGTTPTKPDDGDGKASGIAVMASGTITIGTQLQAGDTISFNGKIFTSGTDFTIGADTTITATNIKNAINALATTSTWTVGNGAQFRDLFNACSSTNVVTVYTRIGSADWNSITITTSSGGRATVSGFSGGASGACGWWVSTAAIVWPSGSKAAAAYGLFIVDPPLAPILNGEILNVRAGNGTTGITLNCANDSSFALKKRGIISSPVKIVIDDGTIWTADSGKSCILTINMTIAASWQDTNFIGGLDATSATDGGVIISGTRYSNNSCNFRIAHRLGGGVLTNNQVKFTFRNWITLRSVELHEGTTSFSNSSSFISTQQLYGRNINLIDCTYKRYLPWGTSFFKNINTYSFACIDMIGGEFILVGLSAPSGNPMLALDNTNYDYTVNFTSVKFIGIQPGELLVNNVDCGYPRVINFTDCEGIENFNWLGSTCVVRATTNQNCRASVSASGIKGNGYALDTPKYCATLLPNLGIPYLNGVIEENTPAAVRVEVSVRGTLVNSNFPANIFDTLVFNDADTAAVKTLITNVAIDENLSMTTAEFAMHCTYVDDTTGSTKYITTRVDIQDAAALTVSTETWYPESSGRPFYTEVVAKYFDKKKFTLTTPTTVKANSMMRVWLSVYKNNTATGRYILVDPYIVVS